ncbi:MAG: hypothetical protein J6B77_09690, partial [Clostridia bacterium]|nr:hypothetical protein [Clostridia bacterium]
MSELFHGQRAAPLGRGLKHAWKNITYGYKSFLCFFIAMFICQSFCQTLILSNATNNRHVLDTVLLEYDYHFSVDDLTDSDTVLLGNAVMNANQVGMEYTLRFERTGEYNTAYLTAGEPRISDADVERMYEAFVSVVLPNSGVKGASGFREDLTVDKSPLMTSEDTYIKPNNVTSAFVIIPLAVVATLLLMFLYRIRLGDRKFTLGICMTFGADFKRLFSEAVTELLLLSAVSLVPSTLFSVGVTALIYLPRGIPLAFPLWQIALFLIFNFAIVYLSVYLPTKWLSRRMPASLIGHDDNTGEVTSPRRSFRILGKSFPKFYELFSFARFRTYYLKLLLTSTLFVACFVGGCYICRMYDGAAVGMVEQYLVHAPEFVEHSDALSDTEDFIPSLEEIDGVAYADWEVSSAASADRACMLIRAENGKRADDYVVDTRTVTNTEQYTKARYEQFVESGYTAATNSFAYTLLNRQMIDLLCERCTVEGDPYAILEKEDHI